MEEAVTDVRALIEQGFSIFDAVVVSTQWTLAAGSNGAVALEAQTVRYVRRWDRAPIGALHMLVSQSVVAMLDHARSAVHQMTGDTSFGSMVLARSTAEAAGRIAWLLEEGLSIEQTVARTYAVRVRSLRDVVPVVEIMLDEIAHGASGDFMALSGSLAFQQSRLAEILAEAKQLEVDVEERVDPATGAVTITGLKLAPPGTNELTVLGLGRTGIGVSRSQVKWWSGIVHSLPWALVQFREDVPSGGGGAGVRVEALQSTPRQRLTAVVLAYLAVATAAGLIIEYYGWPTTEWDRWLTDGHQRILATVSASSEAS